MIDIILDDFVYEDNLSEHQDVIDDFMELMGTAVYKVDKKAELNTEDMITIAIVFKYFIDNYDELPEDVKSKITKIY